jgi:hypothetical protein
VIRRKLTLAYRRQQEAVSLLCGRRTVKCGVPSSFLLDRNLFADFLLHQGDLEHPFAEVFLGSGREKQPIRAAL